jgi:hypothetical protein
MFSFFRNMFRDEYVEWDGLSRAFEVPRKTMSLPANRLLTPLQMMGSRTGAAMRSTVDNRQGTMRLRVPSRVELSTVDGIARGQPPDVPFVSAFNGYPQAILRLSETRQNVLQRMRFAVKQVRYF